MVYVYLIHIHQLWHRSCMIQLHHLCYCRIQLHHRCTTCGTGSARYKLHHLWYQELQDTVAPPKVQELQDTVAPLVEQELQDTVAPPAVQELSGLPRLCLCCCRFFIVYFIVALTNNGGLIEPGLHNLTPCYRAFQQTV